MATHTADDGPNGVEFIVEEDGSITAKDRETGLARGGSSRAEALSQLAEVLTLHEGGGEPIDDPVSFLEDIGISPTEKSDVESHPDFLQ